MGNELHITYHTVLLQRFGGYALRDIYGNLRLMIEAEVAVVRNVLMFNVT